MHFIPGMVATVKWKMMPAILFLVSDLAEGTYRFEFSATAVGGGSDSDQVDVTVLPEGATTVAVSGELKKWHRVTLHCPGPATSETAEPNPFADYRLDATFSHPGSGKSYVVPGFYAADGDAAESSGDAGDQWQVRFRPDEEGTWNYVLSFRSGDDIAIDAGAGISAGYFDGEAGSFEVGPTDKAAPDLRAKGRLEYVGAHHLRFAETGEWFMKCGTDAPENLLAYEDFDATPDAGNRRKSWSPHAADYDASRMSGFTWQGGKGSELLGAIDYLASEGLNAFSFLTFNIDGDDDNVFPHRLVGDVDAYEAVSDNQRWNGGVVYKDRFDVSKLDQWDRIMSFGGTRGMFLHFKTQETENDQRLDGGALGRERILYYRELVARFGHHLALNWNIGEENTNTPAQRIEFAQWFHDHDPYRHPVVLHTYPDQKSAVYSPLLGNASTYAGASLQTNNASFSKVFADTLAWVGNSAAAGRKWVVACDEPGDAQHALRPDDDAGNSHLDGRRNALWGHALAGGAGVEWYFGYRHAHSDLTCQDFRSRDRFWDVCRHFLEFWEISGAPFWTMSNANALVSGSGNNANRCLASPGSHYVVQLYRGDGGGTTTLDLTGAAGDLFVRWFDPRNGGAMRQGSVTTVSGGGVVTLGRAPDSPDEDWIVHVSPARMDSPVPAG
ncbi:DUF5060 domain-containing protein [Haloferula sp. A504]|uniref:DUF5060 domain-containing protein n=1 Tax=Haloferula sp. A504 TaxID=3373601 RepID=UPI0031BFF7A3|nr:DUF5060 domain-containing protein [Verrucomicrobiaceae bacterium E54]